ncbi:MAG: hypothetical protein ACI358_05710 [Candidatus Limimorpha sp.]
MSFDFTNYTFSGLLSILASLYGVGYPLIVQSIGSIYKQYNSDLLSQRFSKEPVYKWFQILMVVNMAIAITAPFILQAGWINQLVITVQAICIVALVGSSVMLFQLILLYSNAGELLKRLEGSQIDKNNVMEILDIAIYADAQHSLELYIKSLSSVFAYIHQQQGDQPNQKVDAVNPPAFYDDVTIDIVRKLKEFIRMDDGHHFLYGNNDITATLYNQISASRLSLQSHKLMWMLLNDAVEFNNHTWFNQYWQYADSYAMLKYHYISFNSPLRHDKVMFKMRHVMIGGMLLHYRRSAWLNDVFFFTHSEPAYYGLIPSSFGDIIKMLELVDNMCADFRYFPQQGFYYHDQMSGVKDGNYFFRDALRYLSLLVIRLWSLEGRGHGTGELFSIPASPIRLCEDERDAQMMKMMKEEVERWYSSDIFAEIPRLRRVEMEKVLSLLDYYQHQCEMDKSAKEEHPTVNSAKYMELKASFEKEAERLEQILESNDEYKPGMVITTDIVKRCRLETLNYSTFIDIDCKCVPSVHCTNFWNDIVCVYLKSLGNLKKLGDFKVSRKQLKNVLQTMGLNDDYTIISTEKVDELPENSIVLNALLNVRWFFVVKKSEKPRTRLQPIDDKALLQAKDGGAVCSNIEEFQSCNVPLFELRLGTKLCFSVPNGFSGYVRFTIVDTNEMQDTTMMPKNTFENLFKGIKDDSTN